MRLLLDHHYATAIAEELRGRGHDVQAAVERGLHEERDEALLALLADEQRAFLTNNVGDFSAIAQRFAATGRAHAGLVFTSDASLPRGRRTIGLYVERLDALLAENAAADALADQVLWIQPRA